MERASCSHLVPLNHATPTEPLRILALPVDLIRLIFSFCPTCALTSVLPRVCKKFRLLALEGVTCITFSAIISAQRAELIFSLLPNLTQLKIGDLIGPLDAPFRLPTRLRSLIVYRDLHTGTPRSAVPVPSSPSLSSLTSLHIEHRKMEGEVTSMLQTCSSLTLLTLTTLRHQPEFDFPFFPALHSLSITGILSLPHGKLIASHASQLRSLRIYRGKVPHDDGSFIGQIVAVRFPLLDKMEISVPGIAPKELAAICMNVLPSTRLSLRINATESLANLLPYSNIIVPLLHHVCVHVSLADLAMHRNEVMMDFSPLLCFTRLESIEQDCPASLSPELTEYPILLRPLLRHLNVFIDATHYADHLRSICDTLPSLTSLTLSSLGQPPSGVSFSRLRKLCVAIPRHDFDVTALASLRRCFPLLSHLCITLEPSEQRAPQTLDPLSAVAWRKIDLFLQELDHEVPPRLTRVTLSRQIFLVHPVPVKKPPRLHWLEVDSDMLY